MSSGPRRGRTGRLVFLALGLFLRGQRSEAAAPLPHPPIQLELQECVPVPELEVRQVVAIELGALLVEGTAPSAGVTRVEVLCVDAQIWLQVDDPLTGKSLLRRIDFLSVDPRARARLLGLAIAELVNASWTELLLYPQPAAPAGAPEVPPDVRRAALSVVERASGLSARPPEDGRGPRLVGIAMVTGVLKNRVLLAGGGLRLAWSHGRHLGWSSDLVAQHAQVTTPLGDVAIDTVHTGAALLFDWRWSRIALHLGGGLRGGVALLRGQPLTASAARGGTVLGPFGGPTGAVGASLKLRRRLVIEVLIEGGYAAFFVLGRVSGSPAVGIEGPFLGMQAGLGLLP